MFDGRERRVSVMYCLMHRVLRDRLAPFALLSSLEGRQSAGGSEISSDRSDLELRSGGSGS